MKSELEQVPGIGPSIARDLQDLGITNLRRLARSDPEQLYNQLCEQRGQHIDRCVLYVFRCGVYFAQNDRHEPELLKWWNWKDGRGAETSAAGLT